jgi:hypothetical protein
MRRVRVLDNNNVNRGEGIYWGIENGNFKIAWYDEAANDAMILFTSYSIAGHRLEAVQPQQAGRRRQTRRRRLRRRRSRRV